MSSTLVCIDKQVIDPARPAPIGPFSLIESKRNESVSLGATALRARCNSSVEPKPSALSLTVSERSHQTLGGALTVAHWRPSSRATFGPRGAKQSKAKQSKAKRSKAKQSKAKQSATLHSNGNPMPVASGAGVLGFKCFGACGGGVSRDVNVTILRLLRAPRIFRPAPPAYPRGPTPALPRPAPPHLRCPGRPVSSAALRFEFALRPGRSAIERIRFVVNQCSAGSSPSPTR
jgi:hypothetical protein